MNPDWQSFWERVAAMLRERLYSAGPESATFWSAFDGSNGIGVIGVRDAEALTGLTRPTTTAWLR